MPDIDSLKQQYFVQPGDEELPDRPVPPTHEDCLIEPILDAEAYYADLQSEIDDLESGDFLYLAGWLMDLVGFHGGDWGEGAGSSGLLEATDEFELIEGGESLIQVLREKAAAGVDVRVLPWFSWALFRRRDDWVPDIVESQLDSTPLGPYLDVNRANALTVHRLREYEELRKSGCLNFLSHPVGSVHAKLTILGSPDDAIAYTGGLDLSNSRRDNTMHPDAEEDDIDDYLAKIANDEWDEEDDEPSGYHDVQAKLRGAPVQDCYDLFQNMWNEILDLHRGSIYVDFGDQGAGQVRLRTYERSTPEVPDRNLSSPVTGTLHVQTLQTLPVMESLRWMRRLIRHDLSFTEEEAGLFTVESAWKKAIGNASEYLYMEDQYLWSHDILSAVGDRLQAAPDLKVILVVNALNLFGHWAVWKGILEDLPDDEIDRVRVFTREAIMVHSKTTLIDDEWAIIGSANCARRSLYTDFEHSVSILDEADEFVSGYRCDLWGDMFRMEEADRSDLADLDEALYIWNDDWGTDGVGIDRPGSLTDITEDISETDPMAPTQSYYDNLQDPDSRETGGGYLF